MPDERRHLILMLDTGSSVNIIKLRAVNPDAWIETGNKIHLTSISAGKEVLTVGTTWIAIRG